MRGRPLAWLALALAGNAAMLALVDAGPFIRYQHLAVGGPWSGLRLVALVVVAVQALLVARALLPHRGAARRSLGRCLAGWRLPAFAAVLFLISATVSRDVVFYVAELCAAFALVAVNLANVVLVATSVPDDRLPRIEQMIERLLGEDGPFPGPRVDRFAVRAALWVALVAAALSVTVYERHPHIPDEISYIYHARYFAQGAASMPLPPVVEAFELDLMSYEDERWYSPVPPGWPAVLAVGERVGAGWLVNPILAGIAALLCYLLVWSVFNRRTARLTLLLLCVSPWFLFMAMSYLTHTASLVAALAACVAMARLAAGGRLAWAFAAGLCLGIVGLIRPLEAVIVGLLLAAWAVGSGSHGRRLAALVALGVGSMALTALHLPYNEHLTGSSTTMPIMAYTDAMYGPGSNSLGFGPERGLGWTGLDPFPGHGPVDVVVNGNLNTFALNIELFGWSFGSLAVLALFLLSGAMRKKDWTFFGAILLVIGVHTFYWFSGGPDFGARYWYLIIVPCVVLTARGIQYLIACSGGGESRVLVGVAAACVVAMLVFVPWRSIDKYRDYRGMYPGIGELARQHDFRDALVIVRGTNFPDYANAAIYNSLDATDPDPVYAWDRGADVRARLATAYSGRRFWVVDGPSVTGGDFVVIAGPLGPEELLGLELPDVPPQRPEVPVEPASPEPEAGP